MNRKKKIKKKKKKKSYKIFKELTKYKNDYQ